MQEHTFKLPTQNLETSCDKCTHLVVCSVFRAFAPLMRKEFEGDMPIDPVHLAKICNKFSLDLGDVL